MDLDVYKKVIDECAKEYTGQMNIHLYKDGESLLHPEFGEFVNYANRYDMQTFVATNGNMLYAKRSEVIGLDVLIISSVDESAMDQVAKFLEYRGSRTKPFVQIKVFKEDDWWKDYKFPKVDAILKSQHYVETREPTTMTSACYHLLYNPAITWEGLFVLCCGDWRRESTVGSVKFDSIKTLWRVVKFIRGRQMRGTYLPPCSNCQKVEALPTVGKIHYEESPFRG
jgi:MoaA/NifB/PqqE/SkfB family radical SAM enzyme